MRGSSSGIEGTFIEILENHQAKRDSEGGTKGGETQERRQEGRRRYDDDEDKGYVWR